MSNLIPSKKAFLVFLSVSGVLYLTATVGTQSSLNGSSLFLNKKGEEEELRAYINFMAKYQKVYATKEMSANRYSVFRNKYRQVRDHNSNKNAPFTLAINQFSDISDQEFEAKMNGLKVHPLRQEKVLASSIKDKIVLQQETPLPEYVNWYKQGVVTKPYSQLSCGSCWAFTAVSTLESLAFIKGHDATL